MTADLTAKFPTEAAREILTKATRAQLAQLLARYDSGAITPAVLAVVRSLQVDLAWTEHRGR